MTPLNLGIEMDVGADFNLVIGINGECGPIDITGYKFKGQMAISTDPTLMPVAAFTFSVLNQFTNKGQVLVSMAAAVTSTLETSVSNNLQKQRLNTPYVFDIEMKDLANTVSRIVQGIIYASPEATQEAFS